MQLRSGRTLPNTPETPRQTQVSSPDGPEEGHHVSPQPLLTAPSQAVGTLVPLQPTMEVEMADPTAEEQALVI